MFTTRQNEPHTPPRKALMWGVRLIVGHGACTSRTAERYRYSPPIYKRIYATALRKIEYAGVAQLAQQDSCKFPFLGSTPGAGSISSRGRKVSHPPFKRYQAGAVPAGSTNFTFSLVAQRTEPPVSTGCGRGFESFQGFQLHSLGLSAGPSAYTGERNVQLVQGVFGLLAQRTEQCASNARVKGSTPLQASKYVVEADRSMHRATNAEIAGSIPAGDFYDSVAQPGLELKAVNFRVAGSNPARVSIVESYNGITCVCYTHDWGSNPCSTANSLTGKHCGRSSIVEHLVVAQSTSARYRPITPMESSLMVGHRLENGRAYAYRVRFPGSPNMPVCANGKALPLKTEGMGVRLPRRVISACSPTGRRRHIQDMYSAGSNPATHTISACGETAATLVLGTSAFGRVGATPTRRTIVSVI